jgi:hypothetical protein
MILLFNVKITSQGLSYYHRNNWLPKSDRLDIFKYCLASYTALLPVFSKCLFFIQLDPEFANRKLELEQFITEHFPQDKLELFWYRNNYTRDWRELCDRYFTDPKELIWFAGNDDHIFIDYDLDVVRAGIELLNADPDPLSAIYYSHWPEQMRLSLHHQGQLTADKNYIKFTWRTFDAIRIIKTERFRRYWFETNFGDEIVFRTDTLWHAGVQMTGPVYAPTRELVRHYDGYSHVSPQIINLAPPLFIPPGFFENEMKVRIGFSDHLPDWTNFNPLAQWLYAAHPHGTDYRWIGDDIPLFWQSRIKILASNSEIDNMKLAKARDSAFLAATRIPMICYSTNFDHTGGAPEEWFSNHMRDHA